MCLFHRTRSFRCDSAVPPVGKRELVAYVPHNPHGDPTAWFALRHQRRGHRLYDGGVI